MLIDMRRYNFSLFGGEPNPEWLEFSDAAAARTEADLVARDLARGAMRMAHERVIVTDETGTVVYEAYLNISSHDIN